MLLNEFQLNDQQLNGDLEYVDNLLIRIEKNITLRETFSGSLLTIEKQIISSEEAFTLITISKIINDANAPANTFYNRNGWEPIITVGSKLLREYDLTGSISVVKGEGDNTTASFTIILYPDVYDLYSFQGKDVRISTRLPTGTYTIFTGKVDVPVVNVIEEKLTLNCVADRRVLLNNLTQYQAYIGYYSTTVLGDNADVSDRITARMTTIPASLDFDSFNRFSVTNWAAKTVPDFSYGSSEVYRRDPQLSIDSSGQIANKVTIDLNFNFQRHHSRSALYRWDHPYAPGKLGICAFLIDAPTIPSREMILGAIDSSGWALEPTYPVYFGPQHRSGSYKCGDAWAMWSTIEVQGQNTNVLNPDGTVKQDAEGNNITKAEISSYTDWTTYYTMSAQWVVTKQFSQNISEQYTITVQSPESISRYGTIPTEESYSYEGFDPYPQWEQDGVTRSAPSGVTIYSDEISGSYFFNADQDRATFNNAFLTASNKAKTTILATHRNSRVTFQRQFTPQIELKHTVRLTGKWIRGKGKCSRIVHVLNVSDGSGGIGGDAYTEVEFRQFRGNTTVTETAIVPPTKPSDTNVPTQGTVILQTHLGEDPSQPNAAKWNGYVGNKVVTTVTGSGGLAGLGTIDKTRSFYQESFTVDTPEIPAQIRDERILVAGGSYNINIPNDDIEYESYG